MPESRPRLIVLRGPQGPDETQLASLRKSFDIVEADDIATAAKMVGERNRTFIISSAGIIKPVIQTPSGNGASDDGEGADQAFADAMLRHVAEAVGVVDDEGRLVWSDVRLAALDEPTRTLFVEYCREAIELLNRDVERDVQWDRRHSREFAFSTEASHYELVVSPAAADPDDESQVRSVIGVMWENTATRRLQTQIDAIDAAGAQLMHIEPALFQGMTLAERLKLLESRIVESVHELLNFDNFEIRLIDRQSNRLELVIAEGINPLRIGEVIYAEREGNGISGYVAATGNSYVCPNVAEDPLYREGLDNAASSLTVPLRMNDRVIGVFNVESNTPNAFDDNDRLFAELFGRYIAMAMNILDLLVVERSTTNAQVSENVLGELRGPMGRITEGADELKQMVAENPELSEKVEEILKATKTLHDRVEACTAGPRTILETEQELHRDEPDPVMIGRRVIVADDEQAIREGLLRVLSHRGCDVTICKTGLECIERIERAAKRRKPYEVVISDIKMPDRNGYEIFRSAKAVHPATQVILMTGFGYDPHHSIVRATQEGLHSFLFKPFKASQLIEELTKALNTTSSSTDDESQE